MMILMMIMMATMMMGTNKHEIKKKGQRNPVPHFREHSYLCLVLRFWCVVIFASPKRSFHGRHANRTHAQPLPRPSSNDVEVVGGVSASSTIHPPPSPPPPPVACSLCCYRANPHPQSASWGRHPPPRGIHRRLSSQPTAPGTAHFLLLLLPPLPTQPLLMSAPFQFHLHSLFVFLLPGMPSSD